MAQFVAFMLVAYPYILGFFALVVLFKSVVIVGGREIAVVERKYLGRQMPQGRVVALSEEVGIQARTLGPGLHFLVPFLYSVSKQPFTAILETEVGLVESIDGFAIPPGKIFAKVVGGHNSFQDGESFLRNGGQKGPQIEILPPGQYRINPVLFKVRKVPVVIIDKGRIGVVTSQDGEPIPPGRLLAKRAESHNNFENGQAFLNNGGQKGPQIDILLPGTYRVNADLFHVEIQEATIIPAKKVGLVTALDGEPLPETEYVASSVPGHDDFQDGADFLANKGERGPQFDVLRPGTYYINPLMFKVELDDVATVERGQVAVVVSNVGDEPPPVKDLADAAMRAEAGHETAQEAERRLKLGIERYVVPKGYRGIQQEVAGPGFYYLNRRAYIVYIVDTTNITIDWDQSKETRFDPLKVISRDGFEISVSVKVVIRVRPDQAPLMVAKIGSVENLIDHVIHPMIDSSFRNQASSSEAMAFMQDRAEEQLKAQDRAREELEKYHCECVSVLISQIILPPELMEIQQGRVIAAQQQAMFVEQQKAEKERIATENTRAQANQQINLVTAQIGVQVAEQTKQKTIIEAEGRARAVEVEGEAEGSRILAVGNATAEAYEKQVAAVGQGNLAAIEVMKSVSGASLKITPDILVSGDGDGGGNIFSAFVAQLVQQNRNGSAPAASNGNGNGSNQS